MSARYVKNKENRKAKIGAMIQTAKNLLTAVFLNMFLNPNLETPMPTIAAVFNWTSDEGIPFTMDAKSNKLAVIKEIIMASIGPNRKIPFPVCLTIL